MTSWYDKAVLVLKEARAQDDAQDYASAVKSYVRGVEMLQLGIKYEKNSAVAQNMQKRAIEYLDRAEKLKALLNTPPVLANNDNNNSVNDMVLVETPNVRWDDVAGLAGAKRCLIESVLLPLSLPYLFEPLGPIEPWRGILLYGPPGTGKTLLVKAVATEAKCKVIVAGCESIFKKYVGESEATIKRIFDTARQSKPSCIVFLDEIDSVAKARSDDTHEVSRRTLTALLTQMDGMQAQARSDDARVTVIGATNEPWALDSGILRRFERRIYIPLPDVHARLHIFRRVLDKKVRKGLPVQLDAEQLAVLSERTAGFSAADVTTCVKSVSSRLMAMLLEATHWQLCAPNCYRPCSPGVEGATQSDWQTLSSKGGTRVVLPQATLGVLLSAVSQVKSSVRPESLARYDNFTHETGVQGT